MQKLTVLKQIRMVLRAAVSQLINFAFFSPYLRFPVTFSLCSETFFTLRIRVWFAELGSFPLCYKGTKSYYLLDWRLEILVFNWDSLTWLRDQVLPQALGLWWFSFVVLCKGGCSVNIAQCSTNRVYHGMVWAGMALKQSPSLSCHGWGKFHWKILCKNLNSVKAPRLELTGVVQHLELFLIDTESLPGAGAGQSYRNKAGI